MYATENKLWQSWYNKWNFVERSMIPCKMCGDPTGMKGTRLCNNCWEVTSRLDDFLQCKNGQFFTIKKEL
ncbi:hypothetical protein KAR91_32440 [Candidatus Pacearchaeota archaeon]|nr:hypothetical protein [Candidatus Pacearchaeota archaeon]